MRLMMRKLSHLARQAARFDRRLDEIKIAQGAILAELNRSKRSGCLWDYEFKVFSQWGEDGILQHLIHAAGVENRTFIEFGVEDFHESNCRFLLMNNAWRGFVIDGSQKNIDRLRASYFFWRYPLECRCAFVTTGSVKSLLDEAGFDRSPGILSIDVDGVDWHILRELSEWRASIVVVEYNALFGAQRAVTVPYDPGFVRARAHWSNLYYGASLAAFALLLRQRGYALVGVNSSGSNAFFLRRDLLNEMVPEREVAACFRDSTFREARDKRGRLLFKPARSCAGALADLPLLDVDSGQRILVRDVL